jgi:thioredoxin-like negative regulator of GroEL
MNLEWLLRFGFALGMIGLGVLAYALLGQRLLTRAQENAQALLGALPETPVIVYFTTPDCAPCKTIQRPALQQLLNLMGERVRVIEIDATQQPDLARKWGVMSVPTTFLLDAHGKARYVNNGIAPLETLMKQVQSL